MATRTSTRNAVSPHQESSAGSREGEKRRPQMTSTSTTRSAAVSVTPPGAQQAPQTNTDYAIRNQRMTVEKGVVDELLLVCSVIGSSTVDPDNENEIVPVTDCLNWLQDLQRALRRDDDAFRPISLLMGNWKVVQQKLLPLVTSCRYDNAMVLTIVKILVILTKPLSEQTKNAGKMVIDTKSGKTPPEVVKAQMKLRENALAQSDMLMEYKRAIVHHSSHLATSKSKRGKKSSSEKHASKGLLSIFVSLLAEPLSKTGTSRSDTDHLTIELVLHLFRNLLSAEPLLKSSSDATSRAHVLHQEIITLFERELVLDILLVIGQEMESRENAQYNLLMMELLHHLLKNQDPTAVARSVLNHRKDTRKIVANAKSITKNKENIRRSDIMTKNSNGSGSGLRAQLQREKQKFSTIQASRHSHFGGTLVTKRYDGKRQYVSAVNAAASSSTAVKGSSRGNGNSTIAMTKQAARKKNRKLEPFVGSGKTFLDHTKADYASTDSYSPASKRAQTTLYTFMERFTQDCYGPVMKSLKNEFRRDSVRLEENDKAIFFRIIWFICQWWRVSSLMKQKKQKSKTASLPLGQLIFTMDMFTFNLVLNAMDTFQQTKKHAHLAQSVALYREMMFQLLQMHQSLDPTENLMAVGLLDRIFYNSEPLDRLPKLLPKWAPGTHTREYLCDLVELTHMTLKVLETNSKTVLSEEEILQQKKNDTVAKMKATALDFDVIGYFTRKIVSNQLVTMYTHLLSQYTVNSTQVNHHIIAMFLRLCKFKIIASDDNGDHERNAKEGKKDDDEDDMDLGDAGLATKTVTLQPMLYSIQLICVLEQILNDTTIKNDPLSFGTILKFATSFMTQFAQDATTNPMLYVECLFRHPVPHRFCELSTNLYVNEELRMIAERDLLLEEQRRLRDDDDDEDDEHEGDGSLEVGGHHHQQQDMEDGGNGKVNGTITTAVVPQEDGSDEEETEWGASDDIEARETATKLRKKKRLKKALKKKVHIAQDTDESEEEETSEDPSSADHQEEEEEDDGGKRKAADMASEVDRGTSLDTGTPELSASPVEKKPRLRKLGIVDDSDDDDDVDFSSGPVDSSDVGTKKITGGNRMIIDDDDDDD